VDSTADRSEAGNPREFRPPYRMRTGTFFIGAALLACAWSVNAKDPVSTRRTGASPRSLVFAPRAAAKAAENVCLGCHGSFDKIIEASGKFVAPSGEKTSPHRYVPHDSKKAEDAPECTNCHTRHPLDPLPAKGSIDLSKVTVQWCYEVCHHEKNLKSCKECHP
jgi:hypothetical protein